MPHFFSAQHILPSTIYPTRQINDDLGAYGYNTSMAYPWEEKLPQLWIISFLLASISGLLSGLIFGLSILYLAIVALTTAAMVALSYLLVRRFQTINDLPGEFLQEEKESIEQVQVLMLMLTPIQGIIWYLPFAFAHGNIIFMILGIIPAAIISPIAAKIIGIVWEKFILNGEEESEPEEVVLEKVVDDGPEKPVF